MVWYPGNFSPVSSFNQCLKSIEKVKIFMKTKKILILFVCLALTLSACSNSKKEEEAQATINAMYTSVAQTLTVLTQESTPVPTETPQATATVAPTATKAQAVVKTPTRVVATESLCDNSVLVSDVTIPDNTVMTPGQSFTKTWSIKNTGTCDWTTSYKLVFVSGNAMSGASTAITSAIASGHSDNVSVAMVAPTTKGTYTGYWIMQNASGKNFGTSIWVTIIVSTTYTATPTGTITPTPNLTATLLAQQTAYAAATAYALTAAAPTAAPTATPVPVTVPTETPTPAATIEPTATTP